MVRALNTVALCIVDQRHTAESETRTRILILHLSCKCFSLFIMAGSAFDGTVSEFLQRNTACSPEEGEQAAAVLAGVGISIPKRLAHINLERLGLDEEVKGGTIAKLEATGAWVLSSMSVPCPATPRGMPGTSC